MAAALPVIGGVLGIANLVGGLKSQSMQQKALQQAQGLTEEQAAEMRNLRAIMSDPNHPMRAILRMQAEQGIQGKVSGGINELQARLAASGFRSPSSAAPAISNIIGRGVGAQGDLERNLISDFMQKRIGLLGGPDVALRGGLSIADIAGQGAGAAGTAFGNILNTLMQSGKFGSFGSKWFGTGGGWNPWAAPTNYGGGGGGYNAPKLM